MSIAEDIEAKGPHAKGPDARDRDAGARAGRYRWAPAGPSLHRFTYGDVMRMIETGVIEEGAPVELIDGVLVDMAHDGPLHNDWSNALFWWLSDHLDRDTHVVIPGSTLRLSEHDAPKPDWWVFPAHVATADARGPDVLLAIEQSDTTLERDLGLKAALYAAHGVREYWVIDLNKRELWVHREPAENGYGSIKRRAAGEPVDALLIEGLSLRLDSLARVGGTDPGRS